MAPDHPEVPLAPKPVPSYERLEKEELEEQSLKVKKKAQRKEKTDPFGGERANKAEKKAPTNTLSKRPRW